MFFDKKKFVVPINGGCGIINTSKMRGMVEHLIIRPTKADTAWDLTILDKEGDELEEYLGCEGRLDDKSGLPLGKDSLEKITLHFENVSRNEPIKVIFKIREMS